MRYYDPMQGQVIVEAVTKKDFSEDERKQLAKEGKAMSDGSYPIENGEDMKHAISLVGASKHHSEAEVKAHIKTRAKALGLESQLPDSWKESAKKDEQDGDTMSPSGEDFKITPVPYVDIMRQRHPSNQLQRPGQFQPTSGQVVQTQDVPGGPKLSPTSFAK